MPTFLEPYLLIIKIGLVVAVIAALGYFEMKVYDAGYESADQAWKAREREELVAMNATILRLTEEANIKRREHEAALAAIATGHQQEIDKNAKRKQKDIDDAVSGALVLRFRADCKRANPSTGGETGNGTGVGDGGTTIELPREITRNLSELANDADAVADQLRKAQDVIREDRRLCGERL